MNFENLLKDLQERAGQIASEVNLDEQISSVKDATREVRERIENDPNSRNAALGGGALLMLMMASKGGRRLVGEVAKTGAVAAMGALAYKAWKERNGGEVADAAPSDVAVAGFVTDEERNPSFSRAMVETMVAAAHADGEIDEAEMEAVDGAAKAAGLDLSQIASEASKEARLERIAAAARTPNHAAQLYSAAALATANPNGSETAFLEELAQKLGVSATHASRIRAEVAGN